MDGWDLVGGELLDQWEWWELPDFTRQEATRRPGSNLGLGL